MRRAARRAKLSSTSQGDAMAATRVRVRPGALGEWTGLDERDRPLSTHRNETDAEQAAHAYAAPAARGRSCSTTATDACTTCSTDAESVPAGPTSEDARLDRRGRLDATRPLRRNRAESDGV